MDDTPYQQAQELLPPDIDKPSAPIQKAMETH